MRASRSRIRISMAAPLAVALLMITLVTTAVPRAAAQGPDRRPAARAHRGALTLGLLQRNLSLSDQQLEDLAPALSEFQQAVAERRALWRSRRKVAGRGQAQRGAMRPALQGDQPPMLDFLESSAKILDHGQFLALTDLLGQRQGVGGRRSGAGRGAGGDWIGREDGMRQGPRMGQRMRGMRGMAGRGPMDQNLNEPPEWAAGLAETLDLSEDQMLRLRALTRESRQQLRRLWMNAGSWLDADPATREHARLLREDTERRAQEILGEKKWKELQELREERRAERTKERQEQMEVRIERRARFLASVLELDDGETAKLQKLLIESHPMKLGLFEGFQGGEIPRRETIEKAQEQRQQNHEAILALLDDEQTETFEALEKLMASSHRGAFLHQRPDHQGMGHQGMGHRGMGRWGMSPRGMGQRGMGQGR